MSVKRAAMVFGIASLKIQSLLPQPWLIIETCPAFLSKTWLWHHLDYVQNMTVNGASTTFGLASWEIQGLHGDIKLWLNYQPLFYAKIIRTALLLSPKNDLWQSVNDFWPGCLEDASAVQWDWPIIKLSATSLGKSAHNNIVAMSRNEHEWSINRAATECQQWVKGESMERQGCVNDFWSCILDNITAMKCR